MDNSIRNGETAVMGMLIAKGIISDLNVLTEWLESEKNPFSTFSSIKEFLTEIQMEFGRLECIVDRWEKGE